MLITDAKQICQPAVGEQKHLLTRPFEQGIGGHRGPQPQFLDPFRIDLLPRPETQQLSHRRHSWIPRHIRLHRQHLAHHELTVRLQPHHIGEGAATINPELPAAQDTGRCAQAASSTQRCMLGWR